MRDGPRGPGIPWTGSAAPTAPDCTAVRHCTLTAYRRWRCRCPEAVSAARATFVSRRVHGRGGHSRIRRTEVDPIAVERAIGGDPVRLSCPERSEAIARLTAAGLSANQIAERLGVASRSVTRYRARLRGAA